MNGRAMDGRKLTVRVADVQGVVDDAPASAHGAGSGGVPATAGVAASPAASPVSPPVAVALRGGGLLSGTGNAHSQLRGRPVPGVDGAWACAGCRNVNFGARVSCNLCGAPIPDAALAAAFSLRREPVPGVDGAWACPGCRNVNKGWRVTCNLCGAPTPDAAAAAADPGANAVALAARIVRWRTDRHGSGARSGSESVRGPVSSVNDTR